MRIISFEEAKGTPELRQQYLTSVDLEEARAYISKVLYVHEPKRIEGETPFAMKAETGFLAKKFGCHRKTRVLVAANAFDSPIVATEDDFLSILIDHEGDHARLHYRYPKSFAKRGIDMSEYTNEGMIYYQRRILIIEVRGYLNQLKQYVAGRRNLSARFFEILSHRLEQNTADLQDFYDQYSREEYRAFTEQGMI